jgi:hypothetical protein
MVFAESAGAILMMDSVVEITGSYQLTAGGYTHTLRFNDDGTYTFTHSVSSGNNRSGEWSIAVDQLTMTYTVPVSGEETFKVRDDGGGQFTLNYTGSNMVSILLLGFGINGTSVTINGI